MESEGNISRRVRARPAHLFVRSKLGKFWPKLLNWVESFGIFYSALLYCDQEELSAFQLKGDTEVLLHNHVMDSIFIQFVFGIENNQKKYFWHVFRNEKSKSK